MTNTVLHIDASARHEGSLSRLQSAKIVEALGADKVITRDLANGLPFLDAAWVESTFIAPNERTEAQARTLDLSDELVAELQAADTIVIGTPMYNFSIPAVLKAWIDQTARAGVTFTYTENGPKGLLEDKKVIVTMATGGVPVGSDYDYASTYLRFALGFIGITDVTILDKDGNAPELAAA